MLAFLFRNVDQGIYCLEFHPNHSQISKKVSFRRNDVSNDFHRFCAANVDPEFVMAFLCDAFSLDDIFLWKEGRFDGKNDEGDAEEYEVLFSVCYRARESERGIERIRIKIYEEA